jgi:Mn2+/Fe2+ NRAMP family transporter
MLATILGAIVLGCAAYEAGNILGGVAGAVLILPFSATQLTLATVLVAGGLLWFNSPKRVAMLLSGLVAVMGVAFLWTAWRLAPPIDEVLSGVLVPRLPAGSGVLVLGLIGTTVVPYNIFLGSGLAGGQRLGDLRLGLGVAIGLGGVISMGVLVVGSAVTGAFGFESLRDVLSSELGIWAGNLFAVGLLGAGLSSAITAPLAAAVTARGLFGDASDDVRWGRRGLRYRAIWMAVLMTGVGFGLSGVRPIPVIILAQALNGILLPWIACLLMVAVNDRRLLGDRANGWWANGIMAGVVLLSLLLGVAAVARAGARAVGLGTPSPLMLVGLTAVIAVPVTVWLWCAARARMR